MRKLYPARKNINKEENSLQLKGSLTVESALVLPLFFFVIVVLIGIMDLYRIDVLIQTALCEGAEELGMYAYCREGDEDSPVGMVDQGICIAYGTQKVRNVLKNERLSGVTGGSSGIVLLGSGYKNELITLKAAFLYKSPIALFQTVPVKIEVCGQARAWTGYKKNSYGTEESEELVYITEWESVYHTTENCTHLNLSIHKVSSEKIEGKTNAAGEHYTPCDKCMGEAENNTFFYITDTGSHYHSREGCGGLTRHIKAVKVSEVQHLKACSRCQGG